MCIYTHTHTHTHPYIHTHIYCIYIYIYILGVARYMYSYRTITIRTSRFGAWGLTTNTVNSPPNPEGGARSNAMLFENRQRQQKNSECCELRLKTKPSRQWPCADSERLRSQLFAKWGFVLVYPTFLIQHKYKYSIIFPYLRCNLSEC